jgi:Effector-associated domain 2/Caspase domain
VSASSRAVAPTTMSDADPARTAALVVGIEKYAIGEAWDLNGPALDACRFADWLLGRGVPAENVRLLASPLPCNEPHVASFGLPHRQATQADVREMLNDLRASPPELLWLFWGGHGVLEQNRSPRLFYADATAAYKVNADLESLLSCLRTTFMPSVRQILGIVDACQTDARTLGFQFSLPGEIFPEGELDPSRQQFVMFAASPGEDARNDDRHRTGSFSAAALAALTETPAGRWPPDIPAVFEGLWQGFAVLRKRGKADQTPTYLCVHHNGNRDLVTRRVPSRPTRPRTGAPINAIGALVDALLAVRGLSHLDKRRLLVDCLRWEISTSVPDSPEPRLHLIQIVTQCLRYSGGLTELIEAVLLVGGAGDPAMTPVIHAADGLRAEGFG